MLSASASPSSASPHLHILAECGESPTGACGYLLLRKCTDPSHICSNRVHRSTMEADAHPSPWYVPSPVSSAVRCRPSIIAPGKRKGFPADRKSGKRQWICQRQPRSHGLSRSRRKRRLSSILEVRSTEYNQSDQREHAICTLTCAKQMLTMAVHVAYVLRSFAAYSHCHVEVPRESALGSMGQLGQGCHCDLAMTASKQTTH